MKSIKLILCLTLLVSLTSCGKSTTKSAEESKKSQLGDTPRTLNCSYPKIKECIEAYLDEEITSKKEREVRELILKLHESITDKTLTFDEAIILGHSKLNDKLFTIKWTDKDFDNPNLKKASRMAELRSLLKNLLKSVK